MRFRILSWTAIAAVLGGAVALTACRSHATAPTGPAGSWAATFDRLPDDENTRAFVHSLDIAAVRDALGAATAADDAAVADQLRDLLRFAGHDSRFISSGLLRKPSDLRAEVGIDHAQIDWLITAGTVPKTLDIAVGRFAPDDVASAVTATGATSSGSGAAAVWRLGPEGKLGATPVSAMRPLGEAVAIAADARTVAISRDAKEVDAFVATRGASGTHLGRRPEYRSLAAVLDGHRAVAAIIVGVPLDPITRLGARGTTSVAPAVTNYLAMAIALTWDQGSPGVVIAYAQASPAAARARAARVEALLPKLTPMGYVLTDLLPNASVEVDGSLAVLTAPKVPDRGTWASLFLERADILAGGGT